MIAATSEIVAGRRAWIIDQLSSRSRLLSRSRLDDMAIVCSFGEAVGGNGMAICIRHTAVVALVAIRVFALALA